MGRELTPSARVCSVSSMALAAGSLPLNRE